VRFIWAYGHYTTPNCQYGRLLACLISRVICCPFGHGIDKSLLRVVITLAHVNINSRLPIFIEGCQAEAGQKRVPRLLATKLELKPGYENNCKLIEPAYHVLTKKCLHMLLLATKWLLLAGSKMLLKTCT
jgi:hypothetical protein